MLPSEHLYPGANLFRLRLDEMTDAPGTRANPSPRDPGPFYGSDVAGRLVLEVVAAARRWLLTDELWPRGRSTSPAGWWLFERPATEPAGGAGGARTHDPGIMSPML